MKRKCSVGIQVSVFLSILYGVCFLSNCAQQGTPTGGPKDTIAPEIKTSIPANKTRNFSGKEIELTFNEYVQVENLQQELIITPDAGSEYESKPTKYGVRLIFKKPFQQSNTTYTLNFRNAIKDITEKNVASEAKIVFSTGPQLDTLYIEGNIVDLTSGQPIENAVVSLYQSNDTLDIKKNKPYYFTKTDKEGNYKLENIRQGSYKLYALDERNNNQRYDQEKEKIGFLEKDLVLTDSSKSNINLKAGIIDETPPYIIRRGPQSDTYIIEMNEGLEEAKITTVDSTKSLPYILENKDPKIIRLYNTLQRFDSLDIKIIAKDSASNIFETKSRIKFDELDEKKRKNKTKVPFVVATNPEKEEAVGKDLVYEFSFSKPVSKYDLAKIQLLADTITPIDLTIPKDWSWNDSYTKLKLTKTISAKEKIRFIAPKGTFLSVEKDTLAELKLDHLIKTSENYGSISGKVTTKNKNYIIQLLDSRGKVIGQQRNIANYLFSYLPAGEYSLRIVVDDNNNGKWDAGSFSKRKTPEDIIYGFEKKKLKENWELSEQNVVIP